jgi:hypothetical protein
MFLAGLRLPFPAIVRELLQYLHVSPSQIRPNGWRYFFATYIQWPTILDGHLMSIREFFHIYRVQAYTDGTIAFKTRANNLFIFLHPTLLSNKEWRNEYFLISGAWECKPTETLSEEQRVLRRWSAPSAGGLFRLSFQYLSFKIFNVEFLMPNPLFFVSLLSLFFIAAELPDLSRDEADRVATILHFAHNINNINEIDFPLGNRCQYEEVSWVSSGKQLS